MFRSARESYESDHGVKICLNLPLFEFLNLVYHRREFETKVTLLWHKILQLSVRQVYYAKGPLQDLTKQLSFLASYLHSLGEDKSSAGLLGAIGFGKKSQLSVQ